VAHYFDCFEFGLNMFSAFT